MKRIFDSVFYFVLALIIFIGCAQTKLANYKPSTPEEDKLYQFFMECNNAYKENNITKWITCFHEEAEIKILKGDLAAQNWVSKQDYQNYLEKEGGNDLMKLDILDPKFTVMDHEATMKCFQKQLGGWPNMPTEFKMIKELERWYITKFSWGPG